MRLAAPLTADDGARRVLCSSVARHASASPQGEMLALMTKLGLEGEPDDAAKKARSAKKDTAAAPKEAETSAAGADGDADGAAAGVAAAAAPKKKGAVKEAQVVISVNKRNKRKFLTVVAGLDAFGVKLADAAKACGKKFASGASVVKGTGTPDTVEIQGDHKESLAELVAGLFGVPKSVIYYLDDGKKEPAF
jgi:density-regulated protein DRP1